MKDNTLKTIFMAIILIFVFCSVSWAGNNDYRRGKNHSNYNQHNNSHYDDHEINYSRHGNKHRHNHHAYYNHHKQKNHHHYNRWNHRSCSNYRNPRYGHFSVGFFHVPRFSFSFSTGGRR